MEVALDGFSKAFPHQGKLENVIRELFIGENILSNVRKEAHIVNPLTNTFLELDVWIPSLQICFEFQDIYHYTTSWESHIPLKIIKHRDYTKQEAVKKFGETIVIVPCWWDGLLPSLVDLIKFERPDLLPKYKNSFVPITLNPGPGYFTQNKVPSVGELMLASFPVDNNFSSSVSTTNSWWMGEKYDGIRCCWHANDKLLYSRSGSMIVFSSHIVSHFPTTYLDMEIWIGRNSFAEAQALVFPNASRFYWDRLRFVAFDDANPDSHMLPFEERYENILSCVVFNHPLIIVASRQWCTTKGHLEEFSLKSIQGGGEGVILRKPKSGYIPGRSPFLVKLKASRGDDEALVMDIKGKTLTLQLPDETIFEVTNQDVLNNLSPKKGDIVSFTYENYTGKSIPIKPQVYRIREDITWQHVVSDHSHKHPPHQQFNESSQKAVGSKPIGFWKSDKKRNMRLFFEKFAKSRNLDPLSPSTWYSVSAQSFLATKGAHAIVSYYKGSFKKSILGLFPDIHLDPTLFPTPPANYWREVANRRKYFEKFADRKGFNPLVPFNWYSASFLDENVPPTILSMYGSRVTAIVQLFPEIGLDIRKFPVQPRGYWGIEANQKQFFEDVAKALGFDPLVALNWYDIGGDSSLSSFAHKFRGGNALLEYYDKSFPKALVHLFPTISFDFKKFRTPYLGRKEPNLSKKDFAKRIFDKYAEIHKFDPFVAANWYSVRHQHVSRIPGASILMDYYDNIQTALLDAYPDIGLSITSFENLPRYHWLVMENRRKLFVDFAKQNNFDPLVPTNWSTITFTQMNEVKGAMSLLRKYYKNNLRAALYEVFPEINWTLPVPSRTSKQNKLYQ